MEPLSDARLAFLRETKYLGVSWSYGSEFSIYKKGVFCAGGGGGGVMARPPRTSTRPTSASFTSSEAHVKLPKDT